MPARLPIQIIQCADYGAPYPGSFVPMLVAAARAASDRGHRIKFVFSEVAAGRSWLADFNDLAEVSLWTTRGSRREFTGGAMRRFESDLRSHRGPSVIHTHFATFDIPAALMRLRNRHVAVFWHEHGPVLDDRRIRLRNSLRYASLGRLVNGMLCVSPDLRLQLRARHAPAEQLHDFSNAIDTIRFAPASAEARRAARASLRVPEGARMVLHFGWDWERKGGDLMLGAAGLLTGEREVSFFTVLGEGGGPPPGVDAAENVRGLAPADDVQRLYAAADVVLSCSRAEGALPLVALEALACGLPIVVTDIPVQNRLIGGLPGVRSVAAEPEALAAGLRQMLALTDRERDRHVVLARERFASFFSLDAWAGRLIDLYEGSVRTCS